MVEIALKVDENYQRLDSWLAKQIDHVSRSRLQKLITQGHLQLNGQICTSKKIVLHQGDQILLTIPEAKPYELEPEFIPLDILYEDESLIIINKPVNLVVHPAPGHETGTLVHALLYHCQDLAGIGDVKRPGIVHRLDKDTTGALVVAKTDFAHQHLQKQLKAKTATREYLGIVYGAPQTTEGIIDLPIGRHPVERKKMAVIPIEKGGKNAKTYWQLQERFGNYTLVQFRLFTGRTHQIRVHSSHRGHPLVGDPIYSSGRSLGVNLPGQALHAHKLTIQHPVSSKIIQAIAPLPDHFQKLLTFLRQRQR